MSKIDDDARLHHMLDASNKVIQFVRNESRESLDEDEKLALALVRLIEIIGEAASKVSREKQADLPQIPWKEVIGMRNRAVVCPWGFGAAVVRGGVEEFLGLVWVVVIKLSAVLGSAAFHSTFRV